MRKVQISFIVIILALFYSCGEDETMITTPPIDTGAEPNVLLIIADDLGKDAINGFTEGIIKPNTPNIDAIRTDGISFENLWVNPTCSPTRSSILTGKYGYRTGVKGASDVLNNDEISLQQHISNETNNKYATAIVGKWHLAGNNNNTNPEIFGIDYYAGLIRGAVDNYYNWKFTEDGNTSTRTDYVTEAFTELAIDWINDQSKPWFMWLAYNAPHTPFHVPPSEMHSQGNLPDYVDGLDPIPYYMATIEAMDFQIGRLLDNMSTEERENTVIIFIGDNGTPNKVAQAPFTNNTVKNTLYQGGINTPMFVSGAGVSLTGKYDNLITGTDLFATIAEITGSTTTEIHDSKSFKSLLTSDANAIRKFQYSEMDDGNTNAWAISDGFYKLIVNQNGQEELYLLLNDPFEANDLTSGNLSVGAAEAKLALEAELVKIRN